MNRAAKNLSALLRLWIVFLLAFAAAAVHAAALPAPAARRPQGRRHPPVVRGHRRAARLDRSRPSLAWNGKRPFNPASVMKLITTYAPWTCWDRPTTWRTELLADGPLTDGVLAGDLHVRGSGDPRFTQEALWLLLRQLRARGVSEIRARWVLDRSRFAPGGARSGRLRRPAPARLQRGPGRADAGLEGVAVAHHRRAGAGPGAGVGRAGIHHLAPGQPPAPGGRPLQRLARRHPAAPGSEREPHRTGAGRQLPHRLRGEDLEPGGTGPRPFLRRRVPRPVGGTGRPHARPRVRDGGRARNRAAAAWNDSAPLAEQLP